MPRKVQNTHRYVNKKLLPSMIKIKDDIAHYSSLYITKFPKLEQKNFMLQQVAIWKMFGDCNIADPKQIKKNIES
jgi:hypothetical protein